MNFYDVLGVGSDADRSEIRDSYRDLASRYHPDVNDHPRASDQFKVLAKARDVLVDEEERAAYDRLGHADYVRTRIDGDLPDPEMTPQPGDSAERGSSGPTNSPTGSSTSSTSSAGRSSGSSSSSTRSSEPTGAPSGGESTSASSRGARPSSSSDGSSPAGSSGTSSSQSSTNTSSSDRASSSRSSDTAATGSTPGGTASGGGQRGDDSAGFSTPPTPGEDDTSPSGPERISSDPARRAARRMDSLWATVRAHFAASNRWLGVVGAAAAYFGGVAGYLAAHADGVGALWGDLTAGDPQRVARALTSDGYAVPVLLDHALGTGGATGGGQLTGLLALLGALALPFAVGLAVAGLRSETTWRPSWVHLGGALGPLASVALGYAVGTSSPLAAIPVAVHLLLVVVAPAAAVASFLVNRLVLVAPLRRREDLGLP